MNTRLLSWSAVGLLAVFLGGFYTGRGQKQVQIREVTKTVEVEKQAETQVVWKDRIVTVTKTVYPNGTTRETTTTEQKNETADTRTSESDHSTSVEKSEVSIPVVSSYSLGLSLITTIRSYSDLLPIPGPSLSNLELTAGYRVVGDVWLDMGIAPVAGTYSLGISIKF